MYTKKHLGELGELSKWSLALIAFGGYFLVTLFSTAFKPRARR